MSPACLKVGCGWGGIGGWGWVVHKFLDTAKSPNFPFPFWICPVGFETWTLDWDFVLGLSINWALYFCDSLYLTFP